MQMRQVVTMTGMCFLTLTGCKNIPPSIPVPQISAPPLKTTVGEIAKKAAKEYSICVWSNAEKMRAGSPDARLVVDTAEDSCKKNVQRLQLALVAEKTDPVFAQSYVDTIVKNAKTEAMVLVLTGNAKDAKDRDIKQQ
ncbi:hypothetical protein EBAPG3_010785 [Nitrosospira lacus]|uniref:Lipoprotein n=1 Tax=Nitrosospira lacus TaxID=1288494 RepID=A0A1W6SQZ3_9PROT|nr:hypothetical protein [Nitrosospira lacus]ARO88227.1 hypothetical protein EBAPG3_010785 [Nitrosospira lacus]